jgi:excisionase family DNA binding protein
LDVTDSSIPAAPARAAEPIFVSVQETPRLTGLSKVTLYRLIAAGELTAVKAGSKTLVEYASLKSYSARLPRFVGRTGRRAG